MSIKFIPINITMKKILRIINFNKNKSGIIDDIRYEIGFICEDFELTKKYEYKDNDIIYINSDCSVPRFKLKDFCEKNNCKITRDINKATAVFISDNFITSQTKRYTLSSVDVNAFKEHLNKAYVITEPIAEVLKFLDLFSDIDTVLITSYHLRELQTYGFKLNFISEYQYYNICSLDDHDKINYILTNPNVYHQDDLLKIINKSVVMDTEMYNQVSNMLNSNDNNDIKLAMELIANLDYDACAVYIFLLFKNFGTKMWDSGFRHHINFKSLLNYFDMTSRWNVCRIDLDDVVNKLKQRDLLTDEALKILMPIAEVEIREYNRFNHFKVKEIEFVPEEEKEDEEFINTDEEPLF